MMHARANITDVANAKWKLPEFMEANDISAYKLGLKLGNGNKHTRIPMTYRLASKKKRPTRVDLETLGNVIKALRDLTGKEVTFDDLLEYAPDDDQAEGGQA